MREGTPSRTAYRVALRRAEHQLVDRPLVLDDPVALRVIRAEDAAELRRDPRALERSPLDAYLRAFMVARSRFAEQALAAAVERGVRQYVLLGAGLDTFAYRNPYGALRVFEVDHPSTQEWKRRRLARGRVPIPGSLTFAPVDFETETLAHGLATAGFDRDAPALFAMLGVVPYLTLDALRATWAFVAGGAAGSGIAFDYGLPRERLTGVQRRVFDAMAERVAAAGEPWKTAFDPPALEHELRSVGFSQFEDLDADAINARYFAARADGLRVGGAARSMLALT